MIDVVTDDGLMFDMIASLLRQCGVQVRRAKAPDKGSPCVLDIDEIARIPEMRDSIQPASVLTVSRRHSPYADLVRPFSWSGFILRCREKFPSEFAFCPSDRVSGNRCVLGLEEKMQPCADGTEKGLSEKSLSEKSLSEKGLSEKGLLEKGLSEKSLSEKSLSEKELSEKELSEKELSEKNTAGNPAVRHNNGTRSSADFVFENDRVYYMGNDLMLTDTERSLLLLLCTRKPETVSVEEINSVIWKGGQPGNSAAVYISYLRSKIDYRFSRRIIITERGKGYRIEEPTTS